MPLLFVYLFLISMNEYTLTVSRNLYQFTYFLYLNFLSIKFSKVAYLHDLGPSCLFSDEQRYILRKHSVQSHTQHSCSNNKTTRHYTNKFEAKHNSSQTKETFPSFSLWNWLLLGHQYFHTSTHQRNNRCSRKNSCTTT